MTTTETSKSHTGRIVLLIIIIAFAALILSDHSVRESLWANLGNQEDCLEWEVYYVDSSGESVPVQRGLATKKAAQEARDRLDRDYQYRRRFSIRCVRWREGKDR